MKKNRNLKKLAPFVATGLVVTALSGVEAFAEETADASSDNTSSGTESHDTGAALSTDITSAAVSDSTPTGSADGSTTSTITVNPGVDVSAPDENGDTVATPKNDGTLNSVTTPGTTTEVTTPSGPPVTETTENPDGSTTTITTTPTETTTTENSTTDITGTIEPDGTTEPTDEDKKAVDDEIDNAKGEDGSFNLKDFVDNIQNNEDYKDVTTSDGEDEDGNKTHTIEFTQSSTKDKPLNSDELGKVLGGVALSPVEGKENTYTYTNADGATVTVTVTGDDSKETATTKWTVTVTEGKTETKDGAVDIGAGDKPIEVGPGTEEGDLSAKDILSKAEAGGFGEEATIEKDKDGNIIKIVDGTKTYEFTYTEKAVDISGMTDQDIFNLLPSDKAFELKDGKIYDSEGHELDFGTLEGLVAKKVEITVTMTDTSQSAGTGVQDAQEKAKQDAIADAVNKALKEMGEENSSLTYEDIQNNLKLNEDGTWSYKVNDDTTINGKVTLKTDTTVGEKDADGNTKVTVDADADAKAEGKVVKKEETVTIDDKNKPSFITDGKVVAEKGKEFGNTNQIVKDVVKDAKGNITSVITTSKDADGNDVETTYTFKYREKVKDNLTEGDYDDKTVGSGNYNGKQVDIIGDHFFIKQSGAGIIWVKDMAGRSEKDIIDQYLSGCPGSKPTIGNVKVVSGDNITFDFSGLTSKGNGDLIGQEFAVNDGKLTITGKISHVALLKKDSIETTLDAAYKARAVMNFVLGVTGKGSGAYTAFVQNGTAASGTQYSGSLAYTYEVAGAPDIEVIGVKQLERNVDVHLESETVTTQPGESVDEDTTPGTPETPETPDGGTTTTPGGGTGTVTVPDGDVPLADIPDELVPLADVPEEISIIDEAVPLADAPEEISITDEEVPLAEIPDELVPLADVPRTGDNAMDDRMAVMAACISGLLLGLRKRRRD